MSCHNAHLELGRLVDLIPDRAGHTQRGATIMLLLVVLILLLQCLRHLAEDGCSFVVLEVGPVEPALLIAQIGVARSLCQICGEELLPAKIPTALNLICRVLEHLTCLLTIDQTGREDHPLKGFRKEQRDVPRISHHPIAAARPARPVRPSSSRSDGCSGSRPACGDCQSP